MVLCWNYAFHNNFNFTFCHRSRWFHSHWRQSSVFLQTLNGLLYQRPADRWENKHKSTHTHYNTITEFSFDFWSDELTVDSPNTLIVFSWLLCSIFPPPRHSQSSPRASTAGPTFSNIWSANNEKLLLTKTTFRPKLIWLHDSKYGFDKKTTKHCWGSVTKWYKLCNEPKIRCCSIALFLKQFASNVFNLLWYCAAFVPRTMSLLKLPSFTLTLISMYLNVPSVSISTLGILASASTISYCRSINCPYLDFDVVSCLKEANLIWLAPNKKR